MARSLALLVTLAAPAAIAAASAIAPGRAGFWGEEYDFSKLKTADTKAELRKLRKQTNALYKLHGDPLSKARNGTKPSYDDVLAHMPPDDLETYQNAMKTLYDLNTAAEHRRLQTDDALTTDSSTWEAGDDGVMNIMNALTESVDITSGAATDVCTTGTTYTTIAASMEYSSTTNTYDFADTSYWCASATSAGTDYGSGWDDKVQHGMVSPGTCYSSGCSTSTDIMMSGTYWYSIGPELEEVAVYVGFTLSDDLYLCSGTTLVDSLSDWWANEFDIGSLTDTYPEDDFITPSYDIAGTQGDTITLNVYDSSTCTGTVYATTTLTVEFHAVAVCYLTAASDVIYSGGVSALPTLTLACSQVYKKLKADECDDTATQTPCEGPDDGDFYCCGDDAFTVGFPDCCASDGCCTNAEANKKAVETLGAILAVIIICIVLGTCLSILACCACCQGCPLYPKLCCAPKGQVGAS